MSSKNDEFTQILANFDPAVQALAHAACDLIFDILPQAVEVPWIKQQIIGYGTGPKKNTEHFAYIAPLKNRVNLGFMYGAELPDPTNLLEGTGKLLRHVRLNSLDDISNPALRQLLDIAITHRVPPPKVMPD